MAKDKKSKRDESNKKEEESMFKKVMNAIGIGLITEIVESFKERIKNDIREIVDAAVRKTAVAVISLIGMLFIVYGIVRFVGSLMPPMPTGVMWMIIGLVFLLFAFIVRLSVKK